MYYRTLSSLTDSVILPVPRWSLKNFFPALLVWSKPAVPLIQDDVFVVYSTQFAVGLSIVAYLCVFLCRVTSPKPCSPDSPWPQHTPPSAPLKTPLQRKALNNSTVL